MAEERKEWLVGAPEFKDRSFTLSEIRELIRDGRIHGSDLVLRIGDVWKSAQDYVELVPDVTAQGAVAPQAPPVSLAKQPPSPPPPPPPPKIPKIVIRPQPPAVASVAAASPAAERIVKPATRAESAPAQPSPPQDDTDTDIDIDRAVPAPAPDETDVQRPVAKATVPPRRAERKTVPPPPRLVSLELVAFTTQDVYSRLRYIFHPLKLLTCALLILVALMTGGLIDLGRSNFTLVIAGWIYFAFIGVFHALAALMTRFEVEGARGFHLLVPFLKRGLTLSINVGMALLLLGSLAFFAVVAYDLEKMMATLVLSMTGIAFVFMSLVFTMTGGYLNAILAVDMCGVREAFSRLMEVYRIAFRRVLGHSAVMVIFSYALFLMIFMPVLAHGVLWMSEAKFQPPKPFIFLVFGFASAFAVAALGTLNVYSYLWITRNLKTATERKGGSETDEAPPAVENRTEAASQEEVGIGESSETQAAEPVDSAGVEPSEGRPGE